MWCVFLCQAYLCGATRTEIQTYRTEPQRKSKMQPECIYACLSSSLSAFSPSLSLSLYRKLAWHNNFRQRVFCPKNESKTFPCGFNKCILCGAKKYATVFICSLLWPQIPHTAELAHDCLCLCVFLCVCARVRVCRGVGRE